MKGPATLLIAVLLLWMCGSVYYYVNNIADYENESTDIVATADSENESEIEVEITKEKFTPKSKKKKATDKKEPRSVDNRTVYFEFNINNFAADDELNAYMSDLNAFLKNNNGNRVTLIGHTDAKGSEKVNLRIGMERAEFVKDILVEAGLNPDQINSESRGEREASKVDTDRSKDRRVEIIVN